MVKILAIPFFLFCLSTHLFGEIYYGRIFKDTFYPLDVYYIKGKENGPTIMVQGGIQGDETSGILTAQLLIKCELIKGNLIVVPRANPYAILLRKRQVNVDLNRRFDKDYNTFYEDFLARAIKFLARLSDGLIHLHEGSGFYSPKYINALKNPFRYGQSIIIDTSNFYNKLCLAALASKVLEKINAEIYPVQFSFKLFNMNTLSPITKYPEQRKSFTYYMIKKLKKPAFAIEVSKNISDLNWKVYYQLKTVIELLSELGVVVKPPKDMFCFVKKEIKKAPLITIKNEPLGKDVSFYPLSLVKFESKDFFPLRWSVVSDNSSYLNLTLHKCVFIQKVKDLFVLDDGRRKKRVKVNWIDWKRSFDKPILVYSLNNRLKFSLADQDIIAKEGQTLILFGVIDNVNNQVLNAKGIVTSLSKNDGQDLLRPILLNKKRFIKRYLTLFNNGWSFYIKYENKNIKWRVKVYEAKDKGNLLLIGNKVFCLSKRHPYVRIPSGKYKFVFDNDCVCFINNCPIPFYNNSSFAFKKNKIYKIKVFNSNTFDFIWKGEIICQSKIL